MKSLFLVLIIILLASCGVSNTSNNNQSGTQLELTTPLPVLAVGSSIPIEVEIDSQNSSGVVNLYILGTQTEGLSLSKSSIPYQAGDVKVSVELTASADAVPTSNTSPIEIIASTSGSVNNFSVNNMIVKAGSAVSNPLDIKIVESDTITFTQSSVVEAVGNRSTISLAIIGHTFATIESTVDASLNTNSSNIILSNESCVFTQNNPICNIIVSNNGITGNYQIYATAKTNTKTYTINPLDFIVVPNGDIEFSQSNVTMLTNNQDAVEVILQLNSALLIQI